VKSPENIKGGAKTISNEQLGISNYEIGMKEANGGLTRAVKLT
jgi:hypothetical protein